MDRDRTIDLYRTHVNAGKIDTYEKYGFDAVMGTRAGVRFNDAFSDRSWINCHCNGGVFNLGHRNPSVISAVESTLAVSAWTERVGEPDRDVRPVWARRFWSKRDKAAGLSPY